MGINDWFWKLVARGIGRALGSEWKSIISTRLPEWNRGKPVYSDVKFENMVKYGWKRNELIFACTSRTANTASQVQLGVYDKKSGDLLPEHPLRRLIEKPNSQMSEFDFWVATITYMRLAGEAYWEKERNSLGQVVALWPLRPDWVQPIADEKTFIGGYEYKIPGMEPVILKPSDVLAFKDFDPLNQYHGYPRAAVAARVGDVDNSTTDFIKLLFEQGGVPLGLLKTKQKLLDTHVTDIRRRWKERYGGFGNWTEPAVLDMDAEYQRMGMTFEEMGFKFLDARNEARICMVMDVPPILIGAAVGLDASTYSNYLQARLAWWEDSLMPLYASFQDTIDNGLISEQIDTERIKAAWDFSQVPALQEKRAAQWNRAISALGSGGILVNEFRAELGLPPDPEGGDFYLRSSGMTPVPFGEKPQPPALPEPADEEDADEEDEDTEEEDSGKGLNGQLLINGVPYTVTTTGAYNTNGLILNAAPNGKASSDQAPDDTERRALEKELESEIVAFFKSQKERISDVLNAE